MWKIGHLREDAMVPDDEMIVVCRKEKEKDERMSTSKENKRSGRRDATNP
jgi:hypothetical protein